MKDNQLNFFVVRAYNKSAPPKPTRWEVEGPEKDLVNRVIKVIKNFTKLLMFCGKQFELRIFPRVNTHSFINYELCNTFVFHKELLPVKVGMSEEIVSPPGPLNEKNAEETKKEMENVCQLIIRRLGENPESYKVLKHYELLDDFLSLYNGLSKSN